MNRKPARKGRFIPVLFFTFALGAAAGWWGRAQLPPGPDRTGSDLPLTAGTGGDVILAPDGTDRGSDARAIARASDTATADRLTEISAKNLRLPIDGADVRAMKGQFGERREGGARGHEAVDILAPRNTPVHATDDGTIEKLFFSRQGGITVYQFDPTGRFCYYYAHLERYAPGLREKQTVSRGDVLGYVGTSGNAPANTPHLHFAIFELTPEKHWWQGTPLDPWVAFGR
jgi:murein DD-endopeptidase MepM/ murein hydrolase activator NlpD